MDLDLTGLNVGAIGTDIVDVSRIENAAIRPGFLDRVYSENELKYCLSSDGVITSLAAQRLAVRFAAKEAVFKALGVGLGGVGFREVEVIKAASGAPSLILSGKAKDLSDSLNFSSWLISLSHTDNVGQAFVIALTE